MNFLKYCALALTFSAIAAFSAASEPVSDSVPSTHKAPALATSDTAAAKAPVVKKTSLSKSKLKARAAAAPGVPAAKVAQSSNDTLIIKARLIEIPGRFPPNDLYNYVYIMKYKVLSIEKGTCTGDEILVGHYDPLIPRAKIKDKMAALAGGNIDKFETGSKQRLVLITPISKVWDDAVEDEYIDSDLPKYYALKADLEK